MAESGAPLGVVYAEPGAEVELLAGQLYFGRRAALVRTLLGSCVAVVLWHPGQRLGGMCHFLLPHRAPAAGDPLDGRFGNEAMELLARAVAYAGTRAQDYEAHLYGGADTLSSHAGVTTNIGERNIEEGWRLVERHGFTLHAVDVGDTVPRHVRFSLGSGRVDVRRGAATGRNGE